MDKLNTPEPPVPGEKKELLVESDGGSNKGGSYRPASFKVTEKTEAAPPATAAESTQVSKIHIRGHNYWKPHTEKRTTSVDGFRD